MTSFREQMHVLRPDVIQRQKANAEKRASALALTELRWEAGMSDFDVSKASGLKLEVVRQMEALSGPLPALEDVTRYRAACTTA